MNIELLNHKIQTHDTRINDHSKRIDDLEKNAAARDVKIDNLCEKLELQTKSINWLIGILMTGLAGFFFYAIESGLFR